MAAVYSSTQINGVENSRCLLRLGPSQSSHYWGNAQCWGWSESKEQFAGSGNFHGDDDRFVRVSSRSSLLQSAFNFHQILRHCDIVNWILILLISWRRFNSLSLFFLHSNTIYYVDHEINQFRTDEFMERVQSTDLPFYLKVSSVAALSFVGSEAHRKNESSHQTVDLTTIFGPPPPQIQIAVSSVDRYHQQKQWLSDVGDCDVDFRASSGGNNWTSFQSIVFHTGDQVVHVQALRGGSLAEEWRCVQSRGWDEEEEAGRWGD